VPILKAGLAHSAFAFIDVISPCVTFNDHEGSTKSYAYTREHDVEVVQADFVPPSEEIAVDYEQGEVKNVMLHDGGWVRLRKIAKDYDATDRDRAYAYIRERQRAGEIATGLLYISPDSRDMHDQSETVEQPLTTLPYESCARQCRVDEAAAALPISSQFAASGGCRSARSAAAGRRPFGGLFSLQLKKKRGRTLRHVRAGGRAPCTIFRGEAREPAARGAREPANLRTRPRRSPSLYWNNHAKSRRSGCRTGAS
jgi:hypothetical protein